MPLLFTILTIHTMWSHDDVTGNIADVRFKNIRAVQPLLGVIISAVEKFV